MEKDIYKDTWYRKLVRFLPNTLINIVVIVIIALMTVVAFDFDIEYLLTPEFYITTAVLLLIYTVAHWAWFDAKVKSSRNNKENRIEHKEKSDKIQDVTKTLEWQQNRHVFVTERNENELIKAWRIFIQNKLTRLREKARSKDLKIDSASITELQRKTFTEEEIEALNNEYEQARLNCKYSIKKKYLEECLTDKWILENKSKIMVDYNEIDIQFIEIGSVISGIVKDKTQSKGKYFKDTVPMRFPMLLLTVFITAFAIDLVASGGDVKAWTVFAFRMLLLLQNAIMGSNYGGQFYEDVDIHNDDSRVSIVKEFKTWALAKGIYTIKGEK